jgi:hypothetical protein
VFFLETLIVDIVVVNFEFREHCSDDGHHVLVQDASSFIQKNLSLIHSRSLVLFLCFSTCVRFLDFYVLALPGSSRARVGIGAVGVVSFAISQHLSNSDASSMFRFSSNNCLAQPNSYQHPTHLYCFRPVQRFDLLSSPSRTLTPFHPFPTLLPTSRPFPHV